MNSFKYIFILFVLFIFSLVLYFIKYSTNEDGGCKELVFKELVDLPHMIESYPFRVWYATEGSNALKSLAINSSVNDNPIVINDLILQLHTADKYFSEVLKLTHPLSKQRYNKAEFIDVHVVDMKRASGIAFDEVIAEKSSLSADPFSCGVKIRINKKLNPSKNITPAHELFHIYQYSNSMFKSSWYLEGMTRWVEQAFVGPKKRDRTAIIPSSCSDVYKESYSASRYWQDLAKRKNAKDVFISQDLLVLKYSNGQPVFKNSVFKHGSIIKDIFGKLEAESLKVSKKIDLSSYKWPERIQRSSRFDSNICKAVESIDSDY